MTMPIKIEIVQLDSELPPPSTAQDGDAGVDLYSSENMVLNPAGGRELVRTGSAVAIPEGYAGFVLPRSGLALKYGVSVLNSPGLIDSGYRGEIKVILVNTDPSKEFVVKKGDRIAQLVVQKIENIMFSPTDRLSITIRGENGFGSTGR